MEDNVGGCSKTFDSIGCSKRGGFKRAGSGDTANSRSRVMIGRVVPLSAVIIAVGSLVAVMMTINRWAVLVVVVVLVIEVEVC
jgi:hypothetical protein